MSITRALFQKTKMALTKKSAPKEKASNASSLEQNIIMALKNIYDPEIPVNIYDLGLIYNIDIKNHSDVFIRMTLTAPGCPVASSIVANVEGAIKALDDVSDAHVELVWDPPWNQDDMSDEAKLALGLF